MEVSDKSVRVQKRVTVTIPSKGMVLVNTDGSRGGARIAMWELWLDLADRHAASAVECHQDAVGLTASETAEPTIIAGSGEAQHTMLAVVAAANAIDGMYGSVKRFVSPPASEAKRQRRILEALKLGFSVGSFADRWLPELDWLFDLRNWIVHHDDDYRPLQVVHETDGDLQLMPVDLLRLQSPAAERAALLAREISDVCAANPKSATRNWVRGWANWGEGPGERLTAEELERRTFAIRPAEERA